MSSKIERLESLRAALRERLERLVRDEGDTVRGRRADVEGAYPKSLHDVLVETGSVGAAIPTEYGGLGLGLQGLSVVLEEMGAADVGDMVPILNTMATAPIVKFGSETLKEEVLPRVASGDRRLAFAVTERESGSNAFAAETEAVREGDDYVLAGEKHWISAVDLADAILLLARTRSVEECQSEGIAPAAGLSMFLVDRESADLRWERLSLPRLRSVTQYRIELDGVRVPANRRVGAPGWGMLATLDALNVERMLIPALVVGATRWMIELSITHTRERRVFEGTPLAQYQAIQHPLAEVFLRLQGLRLLLERSTELYDSGVDPFRVSLPTAAARFASVELADLALEAGRTALGARGFEPDVGLLDFAQVAQLFKLAPVSNPVLLNFVAEHHLGMPRSGG